VKKSAAKAVRVPRGAPREAPPARAAPPRVAVPVERFVSELGQGETLIAVGLSGYGKTHAVRHGTLASSRLFVVDPNAVLDRQRGAALEREAWGDCDLWVYYDELKARWKDEETSPILPGRGFRIVFDPCSLDEATMGARIARALDWIWICGDVDVVLEEAAAYSRWIVPVVNRIASRGGHKGLRFYLLSQSYGRITIDARRHPARILAYPQGDENDMTELSRKIGRSRADHLRRLQKGDFSPVLWEQGQLEESPQ
jgi:hypothetical protein